jgi:stringent starvation protein B
VEVGGCGLGRGHEATVAVDGREAEPGEGVLAVLEVAADAEKVDEREGDDEKESYAEADRDEARDTADLSSRRSARFRCGLRLVRARREWQRRR